MFALRPRLVCLGAPLKRKPVAKSPRIIMAWTWMCTHQDESRTKCHAPVKPPCAQNPGLAHPGLCSGERRHQRPRERRANEQWARAEPATPGRGIRLARPQAPQQGVDLLRRHGAVAGPAARDGDGWQATPRGVTAFRVRAGLLRCLLHQVPGNRQSLLRCGAIVRLMMIVHFLLLQLDWQ